MSLSSQVGVLATRIGTEIKALRSTLVPVTQRGPIGGLVESPGVTGTVNLDPALSNHRRLIAVGDVNIASMPAGVDGQRLLLEVNASAGQRIVTFDPAYELSNVVTVRTFTIPAGQWSYITLICRSGTWRLTSAEPQVVPDYSTPSAWLPSDHGLSAWSYDPIHSTGAYLPALNGQMFGAAVKLAVPATVSSITHTTTTNGSGFTANRNAIGIYNTAGTLLTQTVDQAAPWATLGIQTGSLITPVTLSPGIYYVNFLVTASTPPNIAAGTLPSSAFRSGRANIGFRGYWYSAVPTSLPATRPAPSGYDRPMWVGFA